MNERGKKKRERILFKAAHYPAVSGCMAPSQNIMMRINSPGTTSFCWRPSQGSASPPNSFPPFPLFFLHHRHTGVCAMSCVDGDLCSSGCISPIIKAAFSSLAPFSSLPVHRPPFLSVHLLKFPLFQDLTPPPPFLFLLYSSLSPSPPPCSFASCSSSLPLSRLPLRRPGYALNMMSNPLKRGSIVAIITGLISSLRRLRLI